MRRTCNMSASKLFSVDVLNRSKILRLTSQSVNTTPPQLLQPLHFSFPTPSYNAAPSRPQPQLLGLVPPLRLYFLGSAIFIPYRSAHRASRLHPMQSLQSPKRNESRRTFSRHACLISRTCKANTSHALAHVFVPNIEMQSQIQELLGVVDRDWQNADFLLGIPTPFSCPSWNERHGNVFCGSKNNSRTHLFRLPKTQCLVLLSDWNDKSCNPQVDSSALANLQIKTYY